MADKNTNWSPFSDAHYEALKTAYKETIDVLKIRNKSESERVTLLQSIENLTAALTAVSCDKSADGIIE